MIYQYYIDKTFVDIDKKISLVNQNFKRTRRTCHVSYVSVALLKPSISRDVAEGKFESLFYREAEGLKNKIKPKNQLGHAN